MQFFHSRRLNWKENIIVFVALLHGLLVAFAWKAFFYSPTPRVHHVRNVRKLMATIVELLLLKSF